MGDSSYMAPDLQSIHDIQKSNTLKENHAGHNGINIDEHCASSIEKENLQELPSSEGGGFCSSKSPPQQNGYHAEMGEGQTHSGRFKPQIESEAAQTDMPSLDENGLISLSSHDSREEDSNGAMARDCSLLPANSQKGMQEVMTVKETGAQAPANIISHEGPAVNEGHPCSLETSNVVLMGDTMEDAHAVYCNASNDNVIRGDGDVPSKALNGNVNSAESYLKEEDGGVEKEVERLDESLTGSSTPPCISTESISDNNVQPPLFHSANESRQHENEDTNVVLMGDTMEDVHAVYCNASNDNVIRGDGDAVPSKALNGNVNSAESYLEEENGVVGKEFERLEESLTGPSTHPCISTEIISDNNVQPPLFDPANESRQHENEDTNELGGDLEAPSLTSDAHSVIQNEIDLSKGERPVTTLISTDLEGWQRFDAEEVNTMMDHTQGSDQRLELWEKLLDDGFDGHEREIQTPPLQLAIVPSPFEESQFGLASPGNPFIEGLERVSSFSETDGFARHSDLPSSARLPQNFEEPSSFRWREGHNVGEIDDTSSVPETVDGDMNTVQRESMNEHGRKVDLQLPSSRKPLASFDAMEPFEAPSFMSLVDPKSHALFEASMPTFQASSTLYGQENGGEKWVANFDLMAPPTQEITRSSSMPRSGADAPGHRPGKSFSFSASREQEPSKKESDSPHAHPAKSSFLSPKFSPVVQKVVDKVRTTPAVANGVLNSVRQVISPKASDKKSTSKSPLTCCMCW